MDLLNELYNQGYEASDLCVTESELRVATSDDSDAGIDQCVTEVLKLLRQRMNMDVVFVSEFVKGQRVFRHVESLANPALLAPGDGGPLEESWCQQVVDGRLPEYIPDVSASDAKDLPVPFDIGSHLSTPIRLKNGEVYGTLCCFSHAVCETLKHKDLFKLRSTAALVAMKLDQKHAQGR